MLIDLAGHPDATVRYGVAFALEDFESPAALAARIALSRDIDCEVRDRATFGIGSVSELDSSEIREALRDRLGDPDIDVRSEAILGLARRKEDAVVADLLPLLDASRPLPDHQRDALLLLAARTGDPTLCRHVERVAQRWRAQSPNEPFPPDLRDACDRCAIQVD
jgi:HEAT repeat protein